MKLSLHNLFHNKFFDIKLNRNVWLILFASAAISMTMYYGVYGILFNIYLLRLGYGAEFIGILNGIDTFVFTLFALLAGILGQRWGIRRSMLLGTVLLAIASFLILFAQLLPTKGQISLFVLMAVLRGAGTVLFSVANLPYIFAYANRKTRNTAVSAYEAVYGFSGFLGSLLGGIMPSIAASFLGITLEDANAYRYPFVIVAIVMVLAVWFIWLADDEKIEKPAKSTSFTKMVSTMPHSLKRTIAMFTLVSILGGIGISIPLIFGIVYLDDILQTPTVFIGTFSAAEQLMGTLTVIILPTLIARWSLSSVTIVAFIVTGIGVPLISVTGDWRLAGLIYVVMMGINNARFTVYRIYTMTPIPDRYQSFASGLFTMGLGLGFSGMSFIVGFFIGKVGYMPLFFSGGFVLILTAVIIWFYETQMIQESKEL